MLKRVCKYSTGVTDYFSANTHYIAPAHTPSWEEFTSSPFALSLGQWRQSTQNFKCACAIALVCHCRSRPYLEQPCNSFFVSKQAILTWGEWEMHYHFPLVFRGSLFWRVTRTKINTYNHLQVHGGFLKESKRLRKMRKVCGNIKLRVYNSACEEVALHFVT